MSRLRICSVQKSKKSQNCYTLLYFIKKYNYLNNYLKYNLNFHEQIEN